jgi:hypothetical protein
MPSSSKWRSHSQEVIARALAKLPPDASIREVVLALRNAYPCAELDYLPYNQWRWQVKEALAELFGARKSIKLIKLAVHVSPLGVYCDWCGKLDGGCFYCAPARKANPPRGEVRRELLSFLKLLGNKEDCAGIFADWLEDLGMADESAWVRLAITGHPRSLKLRCAAAISFVRRWIPNCPK